MRFFQDSSGDTAFEPGRNQSESEEALAAAPIGAEARDQNRMLHGPPEGDALIRISSSVFIRLVTPFPTILRAKARAQTRASAPA
jgi:hypothetical protein